MVTFFTIPKPFEGVIGISQKNAIKSWLALHPGSEVIVFGNEKGAAEAAKEIGFRHVKEVRRNQFGTPLISEAFKVAKNIAKHDKLVYINTDIILLTNLSDVAKRIILKEYFVVGRRIDLDFKEVVNSTNPQWQKELLDQARKVGRIHGYSGIDYFLFPKSLSPEMPPFPVGRPGWDSWFLYYIRSRKIPLIDATEVVTAIHQNHPYMYRPTDKESLKSVELAGGLMNMMTIREADWVLTAKGLERPPFVRRLLRNLSHLYPWRLILALKRKAQRAFLYSSK